MNAESHPTRPAPLRRRTPSALIRVWPGGPGPSAAKTLAAVTSRMGEAPGLTRLEDGLFAVLPEAGDPAVFDAALAFAREILEPEVRGSAVPDSLAASILIFPGVAVVGEGVAPVDDPLARDLAAKPPAFAGPGVYMTSRAAKMLEDPPQLISGGEYVGPSGKPVPLVQTGPSRPDNPPWRNPEILGRRVKPVGRPRQEGELEELLARPLALVQGPIGVGKTRLVWEALERRPGRFLWLRARPARAPRPELAHQVLDNLLTPTRRQQSDPRHPGSSPPPELEQVRQRLAAWRERADPDGPEGAAAVIQLAVERLTGGDERLVLVFDDLHQAHPTDVAFLEALAAAEPAGGRIGIVLVTRGEAGLPESLASAPRLDLAPLDEEQMEELADRLGEGLSLPPAVRRRLVAATLGFPFALEEGLFALVHGRSLRRVYGSFFFGGDETADYLPSPRLTRHVEAEVARLAPTLPVRLLALAEAPVPASELAAAASLLGEEVALDWEGRLVGAGMLQPADTPWGSGVEFGCPAFRAALASGLPDEEAAEVRGRLGELLAARSRGGDANWRAYRLLAGTPEALEPLLELAKGSGAGHVPREELLEVLTRELRLHREREGEAKIELEILWRLLPLARRLGKLNSYSEDLTRGIELSSSDPSRTLALASLKADLDADVGRYAEAEATIQKALKAAAGGDQRRQALLLIQLGRLLLRSGRTAEATRIFNSLREALAGSGTSALAATCRFFLGNIALQEQRLEDAYEHHQAALEERQRQKLLRPLGSSLSALGQVSLELGNYPEALRFYREAQEILEEHGRESELGSALLGVARVLTRLGDFTAASRPAKLALVLHQGRDDVGDEAIARLAVAKSHLNLGQPESALAEAREAHFKLSMLSLEEALADAEELLGRIRFGQRKFEEARGRFETALGLHRKLGDAKACGFDQAWLLETALALDDDAGIRKSVGDLKSTMTDLGEFDLSEILSFRLYRGLDWLQRKGRKVGDPLPYLARAYRQVLRKAAHLEPDQRHRFLFQIPDNQTIVEIATRQGLAAEPD